MSESWERWAKCRGADPEEAFVAANTVEATKFIRTYCGVCPVVDECLDLAMRAESGMTRHGIFGGLTSSDRANLDRFGWRDCSCGVRFIPSERSRGTRTGCSRCSRRSAAAVAADGVAA